MNRYLWAVSFLCCCVISVQSSFALAQTNTVQPGSGKKSTISAKIDAAIASFQSGNYEKSIMEFEEAYKVLNDVNILFNIARCYQLMEDWENAKEYFNRFIYHPDVNEDSKVRARQYLSEVEEEIEAEKDRRAKAVNSGNGNVERATSGESEAQTKMVLDAVDADNKNALSEDSFQQSPPLRSHALEATLAGSGALLLVVGSISGAMALRSQKEFENDNTSVDTMKELEKEANTRALISDICMATGFALATAGMIIWIAKHKRQKSSQEKMALSPAVSSDGAGLSLLVHF